MVDGPRARPAVSAVRARGALDALQGSQSENSSRAGHAAREVVIPMPSCEDLGTAHLSPCLDRVTLTYGQPDPAGTQKVPPRPGGRQQHLSAVWDMVLESRGVQGTLRISFPCFIVVMGGSILPKGQDMVGMFAYRLLSALAGAEEGGADWGGKDGDHGSSLWAQCGHGVGQAEAEVGGRGVACHARPCGEAAEGGGGGVGIIDVEGEDNDPPHPLEPAQCCQIS